LLEASFFFITVTKCCIQNKNTKKKTAKETADKKKTNKKKRKQVTEGSATVAMYRVKYFFLILCQQSGKRVAHQQRMGDEKYKKQGRLKVKVGSPAGWKFLALFYLVIEELIFCLK